MPIIPNDQYRAYEPKGRVSLLDAGPNITGPSGVSIMEKTAISEIQEQGKISKNITKQTLTWQKEFAEADLNNTVFTMTLDAMEELETKVIEETKNPDYQNSVARFKSSIEEITNRISENADLRTRRLFTQQFLPLAFDKQNKVKWNAYKRGIEWLKASALSNYDKTLRLALQNPQRADEYIARYQLSNLSNVKKGLFTMAYARSLNQSIKHDLLKKQAFLSADGMGSEAGLEWISNLRNVPDLKREDRNEIIASLKSVWNIQKLKDKEAHDKKVSDVEDDFIQRIYDSDKYGILTTGEILENKLLPPRGKGSKQYYADMLNKTVEAKLKGTPDPWTKSDPKFLANYWIQVNEGKIPAKDIRPVEGKMTVDQARTFKKEAKEIAAANRDPALRRYQELKNLAKSSGARQIQIGGMMSGFDADSLARAQKFTSDLLQTLWKEEDLQKRIDMLTVGHLDYIVDKLVLPHRRTIRQQMSDLRKNLQLDVVGGTVVEREAVRLLRRNGREVSEKTIKAVVDQLNQMLKSGKSKSND